jgi:hypothetical protein
MRTNDRTPAQLYSLVIGGVLLLIGILGWFVETNFDFGSDVEGEPLLGFEINGPHNIVHLASGLLGVLAARTVASAKAFSLAFGAVYLLVSIIGFIQGDNVLGLIPVNMADNFLHLFLGALGLAAYFLTRDRTTTVDTGVGRGSVGSRDRV